MRPRRFRSQNFRAAALGLTLGVGAWGAAGPALAAEDDAWDQKLIRGILEGIGLQRDGTGIDYQERPPLVIPPSTSLPPPERTDAAVVNNPAWPNDPDVARQKAEAKKARERRMVGAQEQTDRDMRPTGPYEAPAGGNQAYRRGQGDGYVVPGYGYGNQYDTRNDRSTSLFSNFFGGKDNDIAPFTGEPPRTSLTEPPRGYQTPSPNQPYGLAKSTTAPKAEDNFKTRGEAK